MSCYPLGITIEGIETAIPIHEISSAELDLKYGYKSGTIFKSCGVDRRFVAKTETATDMAVAALSKAMKSAQCSIDDIDCIISACGTMEQAIPYNAAKVIARFTATKPIQSFDVNMTCLSFLKGFELAGMMLHSGIYKRVAVVSSEVASVGIDGSDLETAGLFGDGAAAVVLSGKRSDSQHVLHSNFETFGEGIDYCQIKGGGSLHHPSKITEDYARYGLFEMKGHELFRTTNKQINGFVDRLFEPMAFDIGDVDWIVPHQASGLALTHMKRKFKLEDNKVIDIIANYGNQISVSIPTALHHLINHKPVKNGDKILLIGTSAGLSIGAMLLQW